MIRQPMLLALGGAHIDRRGQVAGAYVPAASNPGTMREDVGGGVFNALRTARRRGVAASLVSLRGGDAAGDTVARAIAACGIADLSAVFLDRATPSYTALIDAEGELITGFADMGLYDLAFAKQLRRSNVRAAAGVADAVLADANLPTAALEILFKIAAGKPVFAIAVSSAKVVRLASVLGRLSLLFMNRAEAAALTGLSRDAAATVMVEALLGIGLAGGVLTSGDGPVTGFDTAGMFSISPPQPRHVADVTGAGDALAGATVAAMLRGLPLRAALRDGVAAAMLAVESPHAVPEFTAEEFAETLALVPDTVEVA